MDTLRAQWANLGFGREGGHPVAAVATPVAVDCPGGRCFVATPVAAIKSGSRWELTSDKVRAAKAIDQDVIFVSDIESLLAELTDRYPQEPDAVFIQKMGPGWENTVCVSDYPLVKPTTHASRAIELCQKYGHINLARGKIPKRWEEKGLCRSSQYNYDDVVYEPAKVQKKHKQAKTNARRAEREGRLPHEIYGPVWHAIGRKVTAEYGFIARTWGPSHYTFIYKCLPGFVKCLGAFTDRFRFKPYVDFLKKARPYRHGILKAELPRKGSSKRRTHRRGTVDQYRSPVVVAGPNPKVIETWREFGKWLTAEIHAYCVYKKAKKPLPRKETM